MSVYFFYGEEDFNIEKEINKLKSGLDKNFLEISYKVYDTPKFTDLISILRSQPLMFGKMLIVINCFEYFSKAFSDKELKEIEDTLEIVNENTDIVFSAVLPRNEGKKLDTRKKLFKILSKYNSKQFALIPTYKTAELEDYIKKLGKTKDLKFSPDALTVIITQIGNNLRQIDTELDKLKLFIYPNNIVTGKAVKEICISNEDLFAFSDCLIAGKRDKAILEFKKLLEKRYVLEILSVLQTMIRRWIFLKSNSKKYSAKELAKLTGMHEYAVMVNLQKMKNTNLKYFIKLKQNLTEAEYRIKSGQSLNIENEVENAIFK